MSGKKVSGTFCAQHPKGEFLAKGSGHFFTARSLAGQRQVGERQGASRRFYLLISNRLPAASALPLTWPKTE